MYRNYNRNCARCGFMNHIKLINHSLIDREEYKKILEANSKNKKLLPKIIAKL